MTVRFDLSGLDSEMPLTLAMMPVLPKHGTDVEHFDNPTLKPPVGTGPYVIAVVQPGERLILRRNPDYWAQDLPVQRGLFNSTRSRSTILVTPIRRSRRSRRDSAIFARRPTLRVG